MNSVSKDGRLIRPVQESKWMIRGRPEYEIECRVCHKAIRFSSQDIPSTHHGRCEYVLEDYPVRIKPRGREKKKTMHEAIEELFSDLV